MNLYCCLCVLCAWFCAPVLAKDVDTYRVGDTADLDIITPVPLDVVDAAATAEVRAARAREYPAIFRSVAGVTNQMAQDFLAAFARQQSRFLAELTNAFHSATLDEATIASPDFERLVTAFDVEHKDFPVTDELAGEWARGRDGAAIRSHLLTVLQWAANRPVRPDVLPEGMMLGQMVRLVPVTAPDQKLSFEALQQGPLVPSASLLTVSNAQARFRWEFPLEQQLLARALAAFIRPNCLPDAPLTQLTRGTEVYQMVVSDHFDAGDAIVRRGDMIDAKAKAALVALNEALKAKPSAAPPAAVKGPPQWPAVAPSPGSNAGFAAQAAQRNGALHPGALNRSAGPGSRPFGPSLTLAGISLGALLVAAGQWFRQRKRPIAPGPAAQARLPLAGADPADMTPQVALAVREAVQQELAAQRRELLMAQQAATEEIAALVRRLDALQVPMQQRLQAYESRIQTLEKELALRNEENRELLKLKIEMINRQMETERAAGVASTVTASS